jgi:UDP-N-acetylglucosamine--N-acetylmuramyl-(pentapeptide) pyrophosphoryl-undecaprenol N-acetylglucosamine transferase
MNSTRSRTIVFAGGGTAGHVEPAVAVASAWRLLHHHDIEVFIGTEQGLENELVPAAGFELRTVPKVVAPRKISRDVVFFPSALTQAIRLTRRLINGADLVVGFGGYVSAPLYLAARSLKIPIVIHEANAKVGWANRLGSQFTRNLACGHPIRRGRFSKALVTGVPLRESILSAAAIAGTEWKKARVQAKVKLGWTPEVPTLLVIGGSQGSRFINSEIEKALPELLHRGVQILHSVGNLNLLPSKVLGYSPVPYISDMATAYLAADIVVARSGAVTCAEFATLGKFALFLPLPVGNGEQARNADFLVREHRAMVIEQKQFSAKWLISHLDELFELSSLVPEEGLSTDLHAVEKIVDLMDHVLKGVAT